MRLVHLALLSVASVASLAGFSVACASSHGAPAAEAPSDDAATPDGTSADAPSTDAPADAGPAPYPAFQPVQPTVLDSGGPILKTARVVPVFFPDDTNQAMATDFVTKYLASPEWKESTAEYGVTGGESAPAIVAPALPALLTSSDDFAAWFSSQLDGTNPVWGATDDATLASTVFVFFVPPGPLADPGNGTICQEAGGWHWHTTPALLDGGAGDAGGTGPGVPVVYAIVGECPTPGYALNDIITGTTSHELAEAFTDPFWDTAPANEFVPNAFVYWPALTGSTEIADLCTTLPGAYFTPATIGYQIQRIWSNQAARAGRDPCQPTPPGAGPYFNAVPDAPDTFVDTFYDASVPGVLIKTGQSRTIDVRLFSEGPTSDWTVTAIGVSPMTLKLDRTTGNNGDVLHLTLTPDKGLPAGAELPFAIASGDDQQSYWVDEVMLTP